MECPNCQFENEEDAIFCTKCGQKLEFLCTNCDILNVLESKFCKKCGYPLRKAPPSQVKLQPPKAYTPKHIAEKILNSRISIQGERKQVTVLASDVAHFTSISEKLDPEDVHAIMDGCFKILMDEIHRYEGTINQFLGDGVMAIFGAPVTHEDHGQRACHAALAIQKALIGYGERLKKEHGIDFKMRIGINTGRVVVGSIGDDLRMDYTALGDTTNIAFLLQQIAKEGQIVLSDRTYRIIKGYFDCEWLGEEKLKHREKYVKYYELIHEGMKKTRLDVEEERGLTRFVNREEDLAMMSDLFERAKEKNGQVICIIGEAGEGKSRLIYEFKKRIDLREFIYLESQCISYGRNIPYYPIVEILRKSFDISESDSQEEIRRNLEVRLKRLDKRLLESVPILFRLLCLETEADPFTITDPEQAKEMTFEAIDLIGEPGKTDHHCG